MPPRSVTAEMVSKCKRMRASGASKRMIAKELFCSWETVRKILGGKYDTLGPTLYRCGGCGGLISGECRACDLREKKRNGGT